MTHSVTLDDATRVHLQGLCELAAAGDSAALAQAFADMFMLLDCDVPWEHRDPDDDYVREQVRRDVAGMFAVRRVRDDLRRAQAAVQEAVCDTDETRRSR